MHWIIPYPVALISIMYIECDLEEEAVCSVSTFGIDMSYTLHQYYRKSTIIERTNFNLVFKCSLQKIWYMGRNLFYTSGTKKCEFYGV